MLIDPATLATNLDRLEEIEKASLRLVVQALYDVRDIAASIFREQTDLAQDRGEDISRAALDRLGVSRIEDRLLGKIDYKRARYVFHPEYAIKQALFVDSKAEKVEGINTATLQTAQTSMRIRQIRAGVEQDVQGKLPKIIELGTAKYITTTIFIKFNYRVNGNANTLVSITIAALPNGLLQERYNPTTTDTIWLAGRDAPRRGEAFRVRLSLSMLREKKYWRVQTIPPTGPFTWTD
jgi:hypothetical protein